MDCGAWFTYMVCAPDDTASNRSLIEDVVRRTAQSGVESDELEQAINKATAGCIMQSERPGNRLFGLGSRWLTCNEYISTDDMLDQLRSLDVDAVSKAARKYLNEDAPTEILASADLTAKQVANEATNGK